MRAAAAAVAAAARGRHARHGAKTRVITAMISKDNLQLPLRMHIKRRRRRSPAAAQVQTFLATGEWFEMIFKFSFVPSMTSSCAHIAFYDQMLAS